MVRPRFAKLPTAQQQAILDAALAEFAAYGFHDASLNRVIEAAGISKGSMYYYFDGKEDLYVHVTQVGLGRLFDDIGPFPVPVAGDAETFWSILEGYYLRLMTAIIGSPRLAALIRGWLGAGAAGPGLQQAQQRLEHAVLPWMDRTLVAGQRVGAVRADLPSDLLITVVIGMGQAMDTWLITRQPDDNELPAVIGLLVGMIRRTVAP